MNQTSIACFLSVVRTGSFSDTARELYITRQAVSKNILEMENELGYPLFLRNCTPLSPTVAGTKLYNYYLNQDHDLSSIRRIFSADGWTAPQTLRLGWGMWLRPDNHMIDRLLAFEAETGTRLDIVQDTEKNLLEHLRTGEADILIASQYLSSFIREPYDSDILCEIPLDIVLSRYSSLPEDTEHLASALESMPYLCCRAGEETDDEIYGRVTTDLLSILGITPEIRILANPDTVFLNVMMGTGFTCSPEALLYTHGIRSVRTDRTVSLSLIWLNRNRNPGIAALLKWMNGRDRR